MQDAELLRDYVTRGSDAAFADLVDRYVDFVYSTARRQLGNAQLQNSGYDNDAKNLGGRDSRRGSRNGNLVFGPNGSSGSTDFRRQSQATAK